MATPTTDLLLGPLTTFTAPPACNSITVAFEDPSYSPFAYPRRFASIASSCFPSGYPLGSAAFTSIFIAYGQQDQHVYFSPGICPSGWSENVAGTSGAETTAFCCQPGFNPQTSPAIKPPGGISTLCTSSIDSTVITTVAYTGDGEADGSTQTFTFTGNNVPAGAIWIRYKAEDFVDAATTTAKTLTSTASNSLPKSKSTATSTSDPSGSSKTGDSVKQQPPVSISPDPTSPPTSDRTPPHGLSTAAKIGLGVGIPTAAILALLIAAFIFFRNRKQRRLAATGEQGSDSTESESKSPAELSGGSVNRRSELPGTEAGDKTTGRAEFNGSDGEFGAQDGRERTGAGLHELPAP